MSEAMPLSAALSARLANVAPPGADVGALTAETLRLVAGRTPRDGCAAALASRIGEAAAQGFVAWLWAGADGALPEMSRTAAAEASYASAARREGGSEGKGERERRRERRPQREERQRKSVFSRLGAVNKPPSRARERGSVHSRLGGALAAAAHAPRDRPHANARDDVDDAMESDYDAEAVGANEGGRPRLGEPRAAAAAPVRAGVDDSVCVAPVDPASTADIIAAHFGTCGAVSRVTNTGKLYAWVQFTHSPSVELALELDGTTLGSRQVQIKRKNEASVLVRETETQAAAMGLAGSASFYPATRGGGAGGGGGGGRGRGRGRGRASSYAFTHGGRGRGRGRAFTPGRGRGRGRGAANGGVVARRVWRRDAGEAAGDSTALAT